jgi:hypothetical protein
MNEGEEPDIFWSVVGGREPYYTGQKQVRDRIKVLLKETHFRTLTIPVNN